MYSCNGQHRIDPIKTFENELTSAVLEKFKDNCPYEMSNVFLARSSYYASFEVLGNSGATLMFNLDKVDLKTLESMLKKHTRIDNNKLEIKDYNVYCTYNDKLLLFSDVSSEWEEVLGKVDLKNEEIEIYLIEEGKLTSTFKQERTSKQPYNYTCGIYFFKKADKLIYWFMINN